MNRKNNIFVELLNCLNIKYTLKNAQKLYQMHPYRNNLYGLSLMLDLYNIKNVSVKITDKLSVVNLETPFVAHVNNDFVLVKNIQKGIVEYWQNNRTGDILLNEFLESWSGVLLMVESNENSIEPHYCENKKKEIWGWISRLLLLLMLFSMIIYSLICRSISYVDIVLLLLLFVGIYVCFILLKKQLNIHDVFVDKLCSIGKNVNCVDVLESNASKLLGVFSWSEIGFGYFVSSLFICLAFPQWIPYSAWISFLTLPYTFWSVGYQYFKLNKWCPMCLIVMGVFWMLFIVFLISGYLQKYSFDFSSAMAVVVCYALPFLIIHELIPIIESAFYNQHIEYDMNRIKLNENVFMALLKESRYYDISLSTSKIVFGNINSNNLITILTNPYCNPCADMHFRVENLIYRASNKYCVQYIFASFDKSMSSTNKMLIAAYFREGADDVLKLYNEWFKEGKHHSELFFKQNSLYIDEDVEEEFDKHSNWIAKNKLHATPTILINGYEFPGLYRIEDLELLEISNN